MRQLRFLPVPTVLGAIALLFWGVMLVSVLNRHFAMYPAFSTHDQGIFNQVFWNGFQGNWFQSTLSSGESAAVQIEQQVPDVTYRRLGQHFTPIHLLWLPLYALFPFSATLLVLQVTLVTAGGIVLFFLARHRLPDSLAMWITGGYFCAQSVIGPNLGNFHDFSQIPLWVFSFLWAVEKKRWGWAITALGLLLLCREDVGIILFSFGAFFLLSRHHPRLGTMLCVVSVVHLVLTTTVIMPLFSDEVGKNFLSTSYAQYATGENPSTLGLVLGMVQRPHRLLLDLILPLKNTLQFFSAHWLPLLFVPALSPAAWVCTAAPLATLLVRSDTHIALSMQLRYTLMVVPGMFYGAILWWAYRPQRQKLSQRTKRLWAGCLALSLLFTFTLNPSRTWSFLIPDSVNPWVHLSLTKQWHHAGEVRSLIAQIPADASVSATDNLLPHVSGRRAILRFPALQFRNDARAVVSVDHILVDFWQLQQYQAAFSGSRGRLQEWVPLVQSLIDSQQYGLVAAMPGVFLLQQGQPNEARAIAYWQSFLAEMGQGVQENKP